MLRVNPILGAMLPKSIFGRTGFKPISLFDKYMTLNDLKSALTVKATYKHTPKKLNQIKKHYKKR